MRLRHLIKLPVIMLSLLLCSTASGNENDTAQVIGDNHPCLPAGLKQNKKYMITVGQKHMKVKILSFSNESCWVRVREDISDLPENMLPETKRRRFSLNFSQVSMVK